jgi:hypothetical protein
MLRFFNYVVKDVEMESCWADDHDIARVALRCPTCPVLIVTSLFIPSLLLLLVLLTATAPISFPAPPDRSG